MPGAAVIAWIELAVLLTVLLLGWLGATGRFGISTGRFIQQAKEMARNQEELVKALAATSTRMDSGFAAVGAKMEAEHALRSAQYTALDRHVYDVAERVGRLEERVVGLKERLEEDRRREPGVDRRGFGNVS